MGRAPRPYRLRARASQQEATRRRIAEAAMELHGSIGPARTTISAVADKAGVQRLTVYRHFPDERTLFAACSGRYLELHPPPDLAGPMAQPSSEGRTDAVLHALYGYYRQTEPMLTALVRDAAVEPLVAEYLGPYRSLMSELTHALADVAASGRDRRVLHAAIGHALAFPTWRSLAVDHGLSDAEAATLMTNLIGASRRAQSEPAR